MALKDSVAFTNIVEKINREGVPLSEEGLALLEKNYMPSGVSGKRYIINRDPHPSKKIKGNLFFPRQAQNHNELGLIPFPEETVDLTKYLKTDSRYTYIHVRLPYPKPQAMGLFANMPEWDKALLANKELHKETAKFILGKDVVTKEERSAFSIFNNYISLTSPLTDLSTYKELNFDSVLRIVGPGKLDSIIGKINPEDFYNFYKPIMDWKVENLNKLIRGHNLKTFLGTEVYTEATNKSRRLILTLITDSQKELQKLLCVAANQAPTPNDILLLTDNGFVVKVEKELKSVMLEFLNSKAFKTNINPKLQGLALETEIIF